MAYVFEVLKGTAFCPHVSRFRRGVLARNIQDVVDQSRCGGMDFDLWLIAQPIRGAICERFFCIAANPADYFLQPLHFSVLDFASARNASPGWNVMGRSLWVLWSPHS